VILGTSHFWLKKIEMGYCNVKAVLRKNKEDKTSLDQRLKTVDHQVACWFGYLTVIIIKFMKVSTWTKNVNEPRWSAPEV